MGEGWATPFEARVAFANVDEVHAWTGVNTQEAGQAVRRTPTATAVALVPATTVRCVR